MSFCAYVVSVGLCVCVYEFCMNLCVVHWQSWLCSMCGNKKKKTVKNEYISFVWIMLSGSVLYYCPQKVLLLCNNTEMANGITQLTKTDSNADVRWVGYNLVVEDGAVELCKESERMGARAKKKIVPHHLNALLPLLSYKWGLYKWYNKQNPCFTPFHCSITNIQSNPFTHTHTQDLGHTTNINIKHQSAHNTQYQIQTTKNRLDWIGKMRFLGTNRPINAIKWYRTNMVWCEWMSIEQRTLNVANETIFFITINDFLSTRWEKANFFVSSSMSLSYLIDEFEHKFGPAYIRGNREKS